MKLFGSFFLLLVVFSSPGPAEPAIPFFTNVRDVHVAQSDRQNYFVIDEEVWANARPDLGDLRLYDGDIPVQYALSEQRAGVSSEEVEAKMLNLGSVAGHAEFDLDTQGVAEYNRIRLRLDAHDFVATASVSGGSAPAASDQTAFPPSTLYDFTKEQLGSNFQLKTPVSSFRYLHVRLTPGIRPQEVKGASIFNLREQQASWTKVGSCAKPDSKSRRTTIVCDTPEKVPISRIALQIAPDQVNFRRVVRVEDAKGIQIFSGEICRVRINRAGTLVTSEQLDAKTPIGSSRYTVVIDNGENPPLTILDAQPLSLERRIYFEPRGHSKLTLYYGDERLSAPVYDYERFFHADIAPSEAQLGPGAHNSQYTGRPDDRPWSERHTSVLWAAMVLAVAALAILAFRGFALEHR